MVIIKILGGLGNQLFQYIFYQYLRSINLSAKIDISEFKSYNLHNGLELEKYFNVELQLANNNEILSVKDCSSNILAKFRRVILKRYKKSHVLEKDVCLNKINTNSNVYLDGYWQDHRFVQKYFSDINQLISFRPITLNKRNQEIFDVIMQTNSVGIHIRRGDYLSSKNSNIYHTCGLRYYINSIKVFNNLDIKYKFFIFSDDIEWVKKNLKINNVVYIDHNNGKDSFFDFYLMCYCNNLIMANSSFSWWAAILNGTKKDIVIAPKYWIKNTSFQPYFSKDWIVIDNTLFE